MNVKQVIVVRTKYPDNKGGTRKLRTGKLMAQAAHASMKVFLDMMAETTYENSPYSSFFMELSHTSPVYHWLSGPFAKICCYVESEKDLLDLYYRARAAGLPASLIKDSGKTEFHGVPTNTCIAIGPAENKDIDKITGDLKLL